MTDGMNGMDRESEGRDYDSTLCPCEVCEGEYRDSEMCAGCTKYDMEGNEI